MAAGALDHCGDGCQDADFDRGNDRYAIPARFGIPTALLIPTISHGVAMGFLVALGIVQSLAWPYALGLIAIAGLLLTEHRLVTPHDFSKLDVAFFNVNSLISITLLSASPRL